MFGQDNTQIKPADDNGGFIPPTPTDNSQFPNSSLGDVTDPTSAPVMPTNEVVAPDAPAGTPAFTPPTINNPTDAPAPSTNGDDDLASIKQEALQQLSPLVSHLDQSAEEKFRTTMMMIQASDDKSLIKTAYDAAKSIIDEKARAQALLDVINEINYFSQQQKQS
jgi:hypothetical protein